MKFTSHPLTPDDKRLPKSAQTDWALADRLKASLEAAVANEKRFASVFYRRLFAAHPEVRSMFPPEMDEQEKKITDMLVWVVNHLRSQDELRHELAEMGKRHVDYGAKPEHYPVVRDNLIGALGEIMGNAWTNDLQNDWLTAVDMIAAHMIRGADGVAPDPTKPKPPKK